MPSMSRWTRSGRDGGHAASYPASSIAARMAASSSPSPRTTTGFVARSTSTDSTPSSADTSCFHGRLTVSARHAVDRVFECVVHAASIPRGGIDVRGFTRAGTAQGRVRARPLPRGGGRAARRRRTSSSRWKAASVCGTELHIHLRDGWAAGRIQPPVTLGHEFAGTVVEVGSDVRHVAEGDFVSAESHVTCGGCAACRTGSAHMCERTGPRGRPRRRVRALHGRAGVRDLEDESRQAAARDRDAAGAVRQRRLRDERAGPCPGGRWPCWVAGRSGSSRWPSRRRRVLLPSSRRTLHPFRLGLARTMGADVVVDASQPIDLQGVDVVFEMSGAPQAITDAIRIARNGGRVSSSASRRARLRWTSRRDLQEPHRAGRLRPPDLRDVVPHAVAARAAPSTSGR